MTLIQMLVIATWNNNWFSL